MRKLRTWLLEWSLPAWAKDTVYRENATLRSQVEQQKQDKGDCGAERGGRFPAKN